MKFILSSLLAFSAIGFAFGEENNTNADDTCSRGVEVINKHAGEQYTKAIVNFPPVPFVEQLLTVGP